MAYKVYFVPPMTHSMMWVDATITTLARVAHTPIQEALAPISRGC